MALRAFLSLMILALLCFGCSESGSGKGVKSETPAAAISGAGGASDGTPLELTPSPEGFPLGLSASEGFALHLFESPSASQGFKKFPPEGGAKRYYDEFTLAGAPHLVITEETNPPRMYFDENLNGDLTDDRPPAEGEKPGLLPNHYALLIRYPQEKVIVPYRFWAFGSNMGGVRFYPACHWSGTLTVNGNPYQVVAFDGNSDGDYSNDPVVVDANLNGKAEEAEKLVPGAEISVEGTPVRLISISRSGLTVRFKL